MNTSNTPLLRPPRRLLVLSGAGLFCCLAITFGVWRLLAETRRHTQLQEDPTVASVWEIGVTHGPQQVLQRGTVIQRWLNSHSISVFGSGDSLQSTYRGDPGGLEIWFDYTSHLPHTAQLECHRTGLTAFSDDRGQQYHGYLDFHGKIVGVYLPGYDHSARHLNCEVSWMPRKPAAPNPTSRPMLFTIDLPPAPRILPSSETLAHGPITQTKQGITVTIRAARLGPPKLELFKTTQRDMTFRLKVDGGTLEDGNVASAQVPQVIATNSLGHFRMGNRVSGGMRMLLRQSTLFRHNSSKRRFTVTDPYGISLVPSDQLLYPMDNSDNTDPSVPGKEIIWVAPVNGAGLGTDVVRFRFDVRPTFPKNAPVVPFDLVVPVETGDEV